MPDRDCLSYWLPILEGACLPTPKTAIVRAPPGLWDMLDGKTPEGWLPFLAALTAAGESVGWPCFLRTGHTAGKHSWRDTCCVPDAKSVGQHVFNLVEESGCACLPIDVWAVRQMLHPLVGFTAFRGGLPISREMRYFVDGGQVVCGHFYWPEAAFEGQRGVPPGWEGLVSALHPDAAVEASALTLAQEVAYAFRADAAYSVDLLWDVDDSRWYVTDMAMAAHSYHAEGCTEAGRWEDDR